MIINCLVIKEELIVEGMFLKSLMKDRGFGIEVMITDFGMLLGSYKMDERFVIEADLPYKSKLLE